MSLHANVCVPARDRRRLERLCRYAARSPLASERLSRLDDGRLLYRLKNRWRDGSTHVLFEPHELVEKLVALVPPPRFNLVRYHGVFAPRSAWRESIVPAAVPASSTVADCDCATDASVPVDATIDPLDVTTDSTREERSPRGRRSARSLRPSRYYTWAELMRRVFALDVLECAHCGGPLRILAAILPPDTTRVILEHLGLPARAPPVRPAPIDDEFSGDHVPEDFADVADS